MRTVVIIGTQQDVKRLVAEQDKAELEVIRARARVASIEDADKRMEDVSLSCDSALQMLQDAYLNLDEDDSLDFETALERSRKLEQIENHYDRASRIWETTSKRVDYVAKEAARV